MDQGGASLQPSCPLWAMNILLLLLAGGPLCWTYNSSANDGKSREACEKAAGGGMIPVAAASPAVGFLSASGGQRLAPRTAQDGPGPANPIPHCWPQSNPIAHDGLEMRRDDTRCRHTPCGYQAPDVPAAPAKFDDINCDRYRSPGTASCRVRAVSLPGGRKGAPPHRLASYRNRSHRFGGSRRGMGGPARTRTDLRTSSQSTWGDGTSY